MGALHITGPLFVARKGADQLGRVQALHVREVLRLLEELPVLVRQLVAQDLHAHHGHEETAHHKGNAHLKKKLPTYREIYVVLI